jgi:hypothetical protein
MKIALFGNMNNMLFQVARYLRDEKHQCTLFLFEEHDHFLPAKDSYVEEKEIEIKQLNWKRDNTDAVSKSEIRNIIEGFDFYIGTDISPAYFFKAGYKLDIFCPHGSDLFEFPFPPFINETPQLWELTNYFFGKLQYNGIKETICISMDPSEDIFEIPLKKIKETLFERILCNPFLYKNQYIADFENNSIRINEFKELRKKYDLIIWQHISQDWSDRGPYKINKGNHILIKGFSDFIEKSIHKNKAILVLLEYGGDVQKSKDYIKELGIEDFVLWLPKMLRKDIMAALTQVDFGVGELGYRRWFSYCSIFEYMQAGLPTIHHRDDDFYKSKGFDLYPMIDANHPEIITQTFLDFEVNKEKYKKIGSEARVWTENYFEKCMTAFFNQINKKSNYNLIENYWLKRLKVKCNVEYFKFSALFFYYKTKLVAKSSFK